MDQRMKWVTRWRAKCPEHPTWIPPLRGTKPMAKADAVAHNLERHPELWPCGCKKGDTPHGAGWIDCVFAAGKSK